MEYRRQNSGVGLACRISGKSGVVSLLACSSTPSHALELNEAVINLKDICRSAKIGKSGIILVLYMQM